MALIYIDGHQTEVPEGTTILEAARQEGIKIPTLCHYPGLNPMGHCRMCLVEVEGVDLPVTACDTGVREGMTIFTQTPRVKNLRRGILELMVAAHPVNGCYTCDRSGNCEFQDLVFEEGLTGCSYQAPTYSYPVNQDNPFIVRDYEKCILCGRCIQVCREVTNRGVLDLVNAGFQAKATTAVDGVETDSRTAGCIYCGQCVQVCPVGAISERNRHYQVREWEMRQKSSICSYCGVGCNLELNTADGKIAKVMGKDNRAVNEGWLCVKGRFGYDYLYHQDRLTTPLIRDGAKGSGKFREASWEEALAYAAEGLKAARDNYSPDAVGVITSAKCTNEENYLIQKFARAVIGTNNIDHCARL